MIDFSRKSSWLSNHQSSWWLNHPSEKYACQIGSFPQIGVKIPKIFELPPPRLFKFTHCEPNDVCRNWLSEIFVRKEMIDFSRKSSWLSNHQSSWWLNHPSEKYACQIGSFPQIGVKIPKIFELPPPRLFKFTHCVPKLAVGNLRKEGND